MKIAKQSKIQICALFVSFIGFSILSWWLLYRDERALAGILAFYPTLGPFLFPVREFLLGFGLNVVPTFLFAALAVVAFSSYFLSLQNPIKLSTSIIWAILFQIIVFASYPILSTDIFSYIFSDRVFTEYGQNVWKVVPSAYSQDPFEKLADWKDQTKVYGAVNQLIYLPATFLGGDDLVRTVALYKAISLIFSIIAMALVVKLSQTQSEWEQARNVRLIFWNPLFVLEILGSGHNDILMIFFLLLGLLFWRQKEWLMAGVALALSVQIKLITLAFFAFSALSLLRKKRYLELGQYLAGFTSINTLAFAYMAVNPLEYLNRVLYNTSVYWQSLPALVHRFFEGEKGFFSLVLALLVAGIIFLQLKRMSDPLYSTSLALLCYLLFFSAAYWNWYVLWLLVLIPFIKNQSHSKTIIVFSFTSLTAYPLLWLSLRFNHGHPVWGFVYYIWIFGVPILIWTLHTRLPKTLSFLNLKSLS